MPLVYLPSNWILLAVNKKRNTLEPPFSEGFGLAYAKWRLSFNVSECKQSGPYEILSTVRLTAAGKRITRCLFDEWKRVREMAHLSHSHSCRALALERAKAHIAITATRYTRHCPLRCYATARFSHSAAAPSSFPSSPAT